MTLNQLVDISRLKSWSAIAVDKYTFGSVQVPIFTGHALTMAVKAFHSKLPENTLMGQGIDRQPHVTVRYGVLDENYQGIRKYLTQLKPFDIKFGSTAVFPPSPNSDGASVLHIKAQSDDLENINMALAEAGSFKDADFDYHPHLTIAYMNPLVAHSFANLPMFGKYSYRVDAIQLAKRDGASEMVPLRGQ